MIAVGVLLGLVGTAGACGGDSPTSPASNDHYISGTVAIFYGWMDGTPVLQEAELLLDGKRVGYQTFVPGADRAYFDLEATFPSAGPHRVAIRVIRQSRISVDYSIGGGIGAARLSAGANSLINYRFGPNDWLTMKAGDKYEATIDVP